MGVASLIHAIEIRWGRTDGSCIAAVVAAVSIVCVYDFFVWEKEHYHILKIDLLQL